MVADEKSLVGREGIVEILNGSLVIRRSERFFNQWPFTGQGV